MDPPEGGRLDAALLAARRGDERAFAVLWRSLNPSLVRYLLVRAPALAEDAAAETWLAAVSKISQFDGDADAFRAWLFTIGRNKVTDEQRRLTRRPADAVSDWTGLEPADPQEVAAVALDRLATQDVLRLLRALPEDQADIIALRVLAGLDAATVGKIVGRSAAAVRVAQHRGLRRLAALVKPRSLVNGLRPGRDEPQSF